MCKLDFLLREIISTYKRVLCGRYLLLHLAMVVVLLMSATSCKEKDKDEEDESIEQNSDVTSNLRVEIELTYFLGEGLGDIAYVEIMYPTTSNFEEDAVYDTVNSNETWTKTLTYDVPATVGMVVSAQLKEDATPQDTITVEYEYSYNIRLMDGDTVVDVKMYSGSQKLTFSYKNDESVLAERLARLLDFQSLFLVNDSGITKTELVK